MLVVRALDARATISPRGTRAVLYFRTPLDPLFVSGRERRGTITHIVRATDPIPHPRSTIMATATMTEVAASPPAITPPPTRLLFSHPAARLVKSIPPRETTRINAHVPRDLLGPGLPNQATSETTGVILQDWQGPLKLHAVSEPSAHSDGTAGNLVFTLESQHSATQGKYGAEARRHLPFRSYASQASMPLNTIPRPTYLGLGAGSQGGDGGSFWFFEDVSEDGAADRWRWEQSGVGNRAIWTVWLFGAPSPVVDSLRAILDAYPVLPPSLPPFLQSPGAHWHDSFVATLAETASPAVGTAPARRPLPPTPPSRASKPQSPQSPQSPQPPRSPIYPSDAAPLANVSSRQPPVLPVKPPLLRFPSSNGTSVKSAPFTPVAASPIVTSVDELTTTSKRPVVDRNDDRMEHVDELNAGIGAAPVLGGVPETSDSEPSKESQDEVNILQTLSPDAAISDVDTATEEAIVDDAAPAVPARAPSIHAPSSFRHSLVAVDPDTGAIIGVVAHNVHLSDCGDGPDHSRTATTASLTPQPSVLRPAATYVDEEARRAPSRRNSVLAADTFAPPPLPEKGAGETVRDSIVSEADNFLSAKEYQTCADEDAESDLDLGAFTSFDGGKAGVRHTAIERHRPDLLRDVDGDDDEGGALSDASGSTVGGPAVKLWRKARGGKAGERKRAAKKAARGLLVTGGERRTLQTSEASVRTSRAETAREGDDEGGEEGDMAEEEDSEDEEEETPPPVVPSKEPSTPSRPASLATLAPEEAPVAEGATTPNRKHLLHGHIPRAEMNTSQMMATEDAIWREAFDGGDLPLDGAYTHLAAGVRSGGGDVENDEADDDDLSLDPAAQDAPELGGKNNARYLHGGTVLIEFLAGSSRITASIIRAGGLAPAGETSEDPRGDESSLETPQAPATSTSTGMLSFIPALPSHILSYLVGSSEESENAQSAPGLLSSWTTAATTAVTSPLTSLWSWFASGPGETPMKDSNGDEDAEEESEWELAIPDFDPNSLASTPRPVYRRKRPSPSVQNGFNVRQGGVAADVNRYSIIHFDGEGIGRRAFVGAGMMVGPMGVL